MGTERPVVRPAPTALVLRALGLGDFLTGLPALRLIRLALPGHRLVLAGPRRFGELALEAGIVDRLLETEGLAPFEPRPTDVDVAIDLHGNGPASRQVLLACHPRRLVAFTTDDRVLTGPRWDPGEHEVDRWVRLIAESFGVEAATAGGVAGSLPAPALPRRLPAGAVVVHPGASAISRQWPPARFVAVGRELGRLGHPVVVTGSGSEAVLAAQVAAASQATLLFDLTLPELFALVARARLVVCGDTGIAHVASAYRTPSVVLFGPVSPAQWGPPPDPVHRALFAPHTDMGRGDPHGAQVDPALVSLEVPTVLQACRDVVQLQDAAASASGAEHS